MPNGTTTNGRLPLDRHVGHRCQRAVAAGRPERPLRRFAGDFARVVSRPEDACVDPESLGFATKLAGIRPLAGARVDDKEAAHRVSIDNHRPRGALNGADREDRRRPRALELLEHPFYKRWSCGELTRDELAHYAGEYRHAVVALADTAKKTGHEEHAREETEHVCALGRVRRRLRRRHDREPSAETAECVVAWTAPENRHEALAVMYAIEAGQPAVSQAKLDGLAEHYGVASTSRAPSTSRSTPSATTSTPPSPAASSSSSTTADADRLVEVAEAALRGNWTLLDGVDARR